jgi:PAS domain S-box-containing protein
MRIKTRLRLSAWIALGVIALTVVSLTWSFCHSYQADRNEELAQRMRRVAFERIVLRDEYLLYREDRAIAQWRAKSQALKELLQKAKAQFDGKETKTLLADAEKDFDATFSLVSAMAERYGRKGRAAGKPPLYDRAEARVISQVFLNAYSLKDNIGLLHELMEKESQRTRNIGFLLTFLCITVGGVAVVVNSVITVRTIATELTALNAGIEIIGKGNLDYRIPIEAKDELSTLGRLTNEMAGGLQESYTSLETLQLEIDERKKAEAQLTAANRKLNDIIEFLPDATFVIDNDKRVIAWNRAIEEMTGITKEEIIGQGDNACTVPFYGERRRHLIDLLDVNDQELESKYRSVQRKGNMIYAEVFTPALFGGKGAYVFASGAPLFDDQGNRVGAIESIRDITDRKRAEESLQKALRDLQELDLIVNKSPAVAFLWRASENWPVEFVSQNIAQFGYAPEDFTSGRILFSDIVHPDDIERVTAEVQQYSVEGRTEFTQEYRILDGSGKPRWIEDRTWIRRDAEGRITHYQGVVVDITERKQAEEALRKSEISFRALFENMSNCVAIYEAVDGGEDFIFRDFNRAAAYAERINREAVVGRRVTEVFPGVRDFGLLEVFQRVWRTGSPESFPTASYRDNRIAGWRENHVLRIPSGEVVAVYDDVTERKQAEERLTEQLSELRRWHEVTLGREMRLLELKREVNDLTTRLGGPPRYASVETEERDV